MTIETAFVNESPTGGYLTDSAYSLGTLIRIGRAGNILGMRWYFPTHGLTFPVQMRLYRYDTESSGTLLASGQFTGGSYGTWNDIMFDTPVQAYAGMIVQVVVNSNPYVSTPGLLTNIPVVNGSLTVLADAPTIPRRNGRYLAGPVIHYPQTSQVDGHCFFTDILFEATPSGNDIEPTPGPLPGAGLYPNSDLVAVAWLKNRAGIGTNVATQLPKDQTTWASDGFVQVTTVAGVPDMYIPMRRPLVQIDCWAVAPNSGRPPWNKAGQLAEKILIALQDHAHTQTLLNQLPDAYYRARVLSAYAVSEPVRVYEDDASWARIRFEVMFHWDCEPS